jgi:hypothetical protein
VCLRELQLHNRITFSFVMGIGLYGLTDLYPLYLTRVRGYSAQQIDADRTTRTVNGAPERVPRCGQ